MSHNSQKRCSAESTKIRRIGALAALVTVALVAPSSAAQASPGSTTLQAYAGCNRSTHTITVNGTVDLDWNRFPNGAYVAYRYATWYVNASGEAISSPRTTGWYTGFAPAPFYYNTGVLDGPERTGLYFWFANYTFSTWGHLRAEAQLGVWNGSYYEWSGWDIVTSYYNSGTWSDQSFSSSDCIASVT